MELLAKKSKLEEQKKELQLNVASRREALEKKARSVGNIVDKSVPISNNEVQPLNSSCNVRTTMPFSKDGIPMARHQLNATTFSLTMKSSIE